MSSTTVLTSLAEEMNNLRYEIRRTQRRRTGIIVALVGAALVASLILRIAPLEPVALYAGVSIGVLLFVVIYGLARRGAEQKVAALVQQLAARERLAAEHARRTTLSAAERSEGVVADDADSVLCPVCHASLSPDDVAHGACPHCGSKFNTTCPQCGTPVADSATVCPSCYPVFERNL